MDSRETTRTHLMIREAPGVGDDIESPDDQTPGAGDDTDSPDD